MDTDLACASCAAKFVYLAKDRAYAERKGWDIPKRCLECRAKRKQASTVPRNISSSSSSNSSSNSSASIYGGGGGSRMQNEVASSSSLGKRGIDDTNNTDSSRDLPPASKKQCTGTVAKEDNPQRLDQRLKQIQYGYNTLAYDNFITEVPKHARGSRDEHPRTPDPYQMQSKRAFDGRIKKWRRELHRWEPEDGVVGETVKSATSMVMVAEVKSEKAPTDTVKAELQHQLDCGERIPDDLFGADVDAGVDVDDDDDDDDDVL